MESISLLPVQEPESIDAVKNLAGKIWPDYYEPLIGSAQVDYMLSHLQSITAIETQIREGSLYFLIQDTKGTSVGYLSVIPQAGGLFLSKLYLTAESRGKGYGKGALEKVRDMARSLRLPKITLTVHKRNPSVKFYEKAGFKVTEPIITDIGGGFVMDDYRMEWRF